MCLSVCAGVLVFECVKLRSEEGRVRYRVSDKRLRLLDCRSGLHSDFVRLPYKLVQRCISKRAYNTSECALRCHVLNRYAIHFQHRSIGGTAELDATPVRTWRDTGDMDAADVVFALRTQPELRCGLQANANRIKFHFT